LSVPVKVIGTNVYSNVLMELLNCTYSLTPWRDAQMQTTWCWAWTEQAMVASFWPGMWLVIALTPFSTVWLDTTFCWWRNNAWI